MISVALTIKTTTIPITIKTQAKNFAIYFLILSNSARIVFEIISAARLVSSSFESAPKEIRKLPSASLSLSPIAVRVCERVPLLAAQAEPVATKTPCISRAKTIRSASIPGNETETWLASCFLIF